MNKAKISLSMKEESLEFVTQYQEQHGISNRSLVIEEAIIALREKELAQAYTEANEELKDYGYEDFDNCIADGLDDLEWDEDEAR